MYDYNEFMIKIMFFMKVHYSAEYRIFFYMF